MIALGATWHPRGEEKRLRSLIPVMHQVYSSICIAMPPQADPALVRSLGEIPKVIVKVAPDWAWGRHIALRLAYETQADSIHYADMDRLLRWIETRPDEWRNTLALVPTVDCLIIGRTAEAYQTHPDAIRLTEALANQVFSYLLKMKVDLSAGSKGFSSRAAGFILENSIPGRALGMDAEWPILLARAGYSLGKVWVDGLAWESADRYRDEAVEKALQTQAASAYDRDPANWSARVGVAAEIIAAGLQAFQIEFDPESKLPE